jgi:hypothetical protein
MMRTRVKVLGVVLLLSLLTLPYQASAEQVFGLNFTETSATAIAGKTADGCSNWTDGGLNGTDLVLTGSNGLVICDWIGPLWWRSGDTGTPDEQLYYSYIEDSSDGPIITVTGLADWMAAEGYLGYTIRIYQNTNGSNATFSPVYVYLDNMTLRQDGNNDGVVNDYLAMVQADNMWGTDGGTRAYVDTPELSANTITIDSGWRNTGQNIRSNVSAIKITGIDPYVAVNPVPAVGVEVPVSQVLSWEQRSVVAGQGVKYDVYLGTDPNALSPSYYGLAPVKSTTDNPADFFYAPSNGLEHDKTYYWRVDGLEPNAVNPGTFIRHQGTEWSFTTQPASARVETDPVSRTVPAGATVDISITALNATTYQWYKDGVPLSNDTTDTLYTGQNSMTLTVYDVQVEDEGYYFCVVDNVLNQPAMSASAHLLTERLVGWWKFDGDLTDSVGELYAGAVTHDGTSADPNFIETGIDGSALIFSGAAADVVTVDNSVDFFNFYPQGYTLSVWVNMPAKSGTAWGGLISKNIVNVAGFGVFHQGTGQAVSLLRQSFGDLYSSADVDDNAWHLITCTFDATTGTGSIYVDGNLKGSQKGTGIPVGNVNPLVFGAELANGTRNPYTGLLDDIRIWSYPLSPVEIGKLYVEFNPGSEICLVNPAYDIAGPNGVGQEFRDCIVNIYDLAPIAETWLECNLIPTCIQ